MAFLRSAVVLQNILFIPFILRYFGTFYLACTVSAVSSLTVFTSRTKNTNVKLSGSFLIGIQDRGRYDRKRFLLFSVDSSGADRKTSKKKVDEGDKRNAKKAAVKQVVKQGTKEGMILVDNLQVKKIR